MVSQVSVHSHLAYELWTRSHGETKLPQDRRKGKRGLEKAADMKFILPNYILSDLLPLIMSHILYVSITPHEWNDL